MDALDSALARGPISLLLETIESQVDALGDLVGNVVAELEAPYVSASGNVHVGPD